MIYMFLSNNHSSGDINSSNLSCYDYYRNSNSKDADPTAQKRRLVCTCAVRKPPKQIFSRRGLRIKAGHLRPASPIPTIKEISISCPMSHAIVFYILPTVWGYQSIFLNVCSTTCINGEMIVFILIQTMFKYDGYYSRRTYAAKFFPS